MPQPDPEQRPDRLVELAEAIELQMIVDADPPAAAPESTSVDRATLDAAEQDQLGRIEGALAYLQRIRQRLADTAPAESVAITTDSTFRPAIPLSTGKTTGKTDDCPIEPHTQFGRFTIERLLGEGGFASVFLANDPQLDRQVALKVPKPAMLASPDARVRFDREARVAASLSHPNIVPIYETGTHGPVAYIASGYCAGPTLGEWIADQHSGIDVGKAAVVVACLAEAVHYAHQRGVVHRDLKPGNILFDRILEQLPADCAEVIRLRSIRQLKFDDIGEQMGRSGNAARKLWYRAVLLLEEQIRVSGH